MIRDSLYFSALFGFSKLPDYFYSPGRIFFLKHLSGHWSPRSASPPWKGPLWFPQSAGPPWKGPLCSWSPRSAGPPWKGPPEWQCCSAVLPSSPLGPLLLTSHAGAAEVLWERTGCQSPSGDQQIVGNHVTVWFAFPRRELVVSGSRYTLFWG